MTDTKHTPTPWKVNGYKSIRGSNKEYIASANWRNGSANADHIVKCVNMHDELVSICAKFKDRLINFGGDYGEYLTPSDKDTIATLSETLKKAGAM